MGIAVHSGVAAAIRSVVFRVVMRPEVSPVAIRLVGSQAVTLPVVSPGAIRLGVSRVVVTEAAEARDKSQDKLP